MKAKWFPQIFLLYEVEVLPLTAMQIEQQNNEIKRTEELIPSVINKFEIV